MNRWDGITKLTAKRGRYGSSKLKAFNVLNTISAHHFLSARALCLMSGIGYYSLGRALSNWVRWHYVARYPTTAIGEGDYMYQLLPKGRSWLKLALAQLPNAHLFIAELQTWQRDVMSPARYQEYSKMPFDDFVEKLHKLVKSQARKK